MSDIVDFHVHVFPNLVGDLVENSPEGSLSEGLYKRFELIRRTARIWKKPLSGSVHKMLTFTRHLPDVVRKNVDQLGAWVPLPSLALESTAEDLEEALAEADVQYAVVIAHPPYISNDFVMELCSTRKNWIPAVNISKKAEKPAAQLKAYFKKGARVLKIHPAADGEGPDSPRYRKLLKTAADLDLPVILHTGCIHSNLLYTKPELGDVVNFTKWFETYSSIRFVLAHMNFHDPQTALDLCDDFPNLQVDTSWQPVEVIGEAVRRMGAERVLFGSDWPLIGNNIRVGRDRIREGVRTGLLNPEQAKLILGGNAFKLLGLIPHAAKTQSSDLAAT
jgi:predicted TIM-barrel fold metal-dependent hydrolase